jgi:hypothetical protein
MIEATIKNTKQASCKDQLVVRNNPFIKGLFVIGKLMRLLAHDNQHGVKQNALIKTVYDELIPSEHYTLTLPCMKVK